MARPRSRPALAATLLLATALLGAACTNGGSESGASTTTTSAPSGTDPTTTTTPSGPGGTGGGGTPGPDAVHDGIRVEVLSSQPDRATGTDARIRVTPAAGGSAAALRVTLDDRDVTAQLKPGADGTLEGVVSGLVEGTNTVTATGAKPGDKVTQRIRSWPLTGPMISGSHLPLLACSTKQHGLGAPTDLDCSAPTRVSWKYITTAGTIKDLADRAARPADLATANLIGSRGVPLIIRYEVGVVNRSIYEIATLDPTPPNSEPLDKRIVGNHRLLYRYGDGCGTTFGQGSSNVAALDPTYLRQGYAIATATFNTGAVQCNDVLSAETTMMVKERFIEEFGVPTATIGEGSGGGAAQLHLLVQNYPGLVDGAVALDPLPDIVSVLAGATDCTLLDRYYRTPDGAGISPAQRAAINGHASNTTCEQWEAGYGGLLNPTDGCDPKIDAARIYDAATNPGGVRCTLQDANVNQFGRDASTTFAERPLDNIGVQYGLKALQDNRITFDQFIALNKAVGGFGADGAPQAARTSATQTAVQGAYENGRLSAGAGDQLKIPMIDVDIYTDPAGDTLDRFRAFSLRDRLERATTDQYAPGFQIWTRDPATLPPGGAGPEAVKAVDRWLTALSKDHAGGTRDDLLDRTRPAAAIDNCVAKGTASPLLRGLGIYDKDGSPCRDQYPIAGDPRTAAGAPRADDIIKCQLKPIDTTEYGVPITDARLGQLQATFPDGVCDYSSGGGLDQTGPSMSDRTYDDSEAPGDLA